MLNNVSVPYLKHCRYYILKILKIVLHYILVRSYVIVVVKEAYRLVTICATMSRNMLKKLHYYPELLRYLWETENSITNFYLC